MRRPWRFLLLLALLCGCDVDDRSDPPPGATHLEMLDSGWCTFEWRGHRFLQHHYSNGGGSSYETIHLCHCDAGVGQTPERKP